MTYYKELKWLFEKCHERVERAYQNELDKLAGEEELEILQAFDDPDDYRDNLEDR